MYELILWVVIIFLLIMHIYHLLKINELQEYEDIQEHFIDDLAKENKVLKKLNLKLLDIEDSTSEEDYLPFWEDVEDEL
jgi:hypothetical protein